MSQQSKIARSRSLKSKNRKKIRSRATSRGEEPTIPDPETKGPTKNTRSDAPATAGPKGVLPDKDKVTVEGYLRLGRTIADALLTTESTRTTKRGVKTRGMPRPAQQPNSTRTKPDIEQKVQAAKEVGPKPGQLPGRKGPKPDQLPGRKGPKPDQLPGRKGPKPGQLPGRKDEGLYMKIGKVLAEGLGLVSEEIKQMDPVPPYKRPGELAKNAEDARAAGKKPAQPSGLPKNPKEIKKKRGERP